MAVADAKQRNMAIVVYLLFEQICSRYLMKSLSSCTINSGSSVCSVGETGAGSIIGAGATPPLLTLVPAVGM